MNLDDLGREWRATNEVASTQEQRERLIAATCRRVERFWGRIVRRDLIETVTAVVLIFVFGRMVISLDDLISRIGAGSLVLSLLLIIWKLHRTRTIQCPAPIDAPVRDFCRIELDRLDRQIQLLRRVLWWYIAPIIVGANMGYIGTNGLGIDSLFYVLFTVLLAWFIYALNMLAVATVLMPLHDEVADVLSRLEGTRSDTLPPTRQPSGRALMRRRRNLGVVWFVVFAALGSVGAYFASKEVDYPKLRSLLRHSLGGRRTGGQDWRGMGDARLSRRDRRPGHCGLQSAKIFAPMEEAIRGGSGRGPDPDGARAGGHRPAGGASARVFRHAGPRRCSP